MKRNAAVVSGNVGSAEDVPALVAALADLESFVRGQLAWALGRIGSSAAADALEAHASTLADAGVLDEVRRARSAPAG